MRNKTVNVPVTPVNRSKPLGFQQVNPSFRLVSPSAMASETELRVVRNSQVAAARTNNFPVSNPREGGTSVEDRQEVQNKQDQQARNSNGKNEYGPTNGQEFSSNGLTLPQSGKVPTPATPNKEASLLPPTGLLPIARPVRSRAPALSLLMILERSPR